MTDIISKRINYEASGDIILAGETAAPVAAHCIVNVPGTLPEAFTEEMFVALKSPYALSAEEFALSMSIAQYYADYVRCWDDGKGSEGDVCPAKERTPERTLRIMEQVEHAPTLELQTHAFVASNYYDPQLHFNLACIYGMRFYTPQTVQPMPAPEVRKQAEFSDFP